MIARLFDSASHRGQRWHLIAVRSVVTVTCAVAMTSSSPASAQPAKPAPNAHDIAMAEARARFDEGIKQAELGDHESARLKFNQAWALLKSPAILYNLARAEQLSGHLVEALEHCRQFGKMSSDPKVTDVQRQRTAENITELSKKVGQIDVEAPAAARVSVDGRPIDPGNADPIPVTPGKHVVEAIADGKVKSVTVEAVAGTITKAKLTETNNAVVAPPPAASSTGVAASTKKEDAGTPSPQAASPSFWTTGRIVGASLFGSGVLVLGAGVIVHLSAADEEAKANRAWNALPEPRASACTDPANRVKCAELSVSVKNQNTREDVRTGLLIGGGALFVGGAVLFLVSSPKDESTRGSVRVVPIATGREAGVAVVGRF